MIIKVMEKGHKRTKQNQQKDRCLNDVVWTMVIVYREQTVEIDLRVGDFVNFDLL